MNSLSQYYENLILWQPDASYKYQPINVSSASRITYNINYLKEFSNSQLQVSYNIYDSEDDEHEAGQDCEKCIAVEKRK